MKSYGTEQIRNVGFFGHGGSGKTSLAEAFLFTTGVITRLGKVPEGNTVSDYLPEEIKQKVSISTSTIPVEWKDVKINVLDTPGYSDFIGEVMSALRVVETGVLVLDGVAGIEVQAEIIWDIMKHQGLPRAVIINKLDRENSGFDKVVDQLRTAYPDVRFVPLLLPVGQEASFAGVVDVVKNQAYYYENNGSGKFSVKDVPADLATDVEMARDTLAEAASEADDEILMKYLEGEALDDAELAKILKGAVEQNMIVPVLAASAVKNIGMAHILDFLAESAVAPKVSEEKAALVFKTLADPYVGKMSFFRVYGGTFKADTMNYNATRQTEEKMGQPFYLRGKTQDPATAIVAGDIAVVAKMQEIGTGDTLCAKDKQIQLDGIAFPNPNFSVAIAPKTKGDEDKLGNALTRLVEEDPTIKVAKNAETKETLLYGIGETHLDILSEKLNRKFGIGVNMFEPRVPYRETIRKSVKVEGKHKKQSGGHGQYGHVWIQFDPNPEAEFEFKEQVFGGSVPKNFFPAVEKGLREALAEGILAGYPVTGIKATLVDGSYHSVDSSEMAFKLAAILAFKKGAEQANPILLEPIVEVTVRVPEAFMGDVIGDLNSKRGRVLGMDAEGRYQIIRAQAPESEMMRYAIDLKALTQGRGSFTTSFLQYEEVPQRMTEAVINSLKDKKKE
ncbi:MAG: elongation factor G [Peptococcaceae bacterium]|nr:elongation factor G [Peptococcaceae bacterium]